MQCYEYLAIRQYARHFLGESTDRYDDLELADRLDDCNVVSIRDIDGIEHAAPGNGSGSR